MKKFRERPDCLFVFEGNPSGSKRVSGGAIVSKAWDFDAINRSYSKYMKRSKESLPSISQGNGDTLEKIAAPLV